MEIIGVGQQRKPAALLQLKVPRGTFSPPGANNRKTTQGIRIQIVITHQRARAPEVHLGESPFRSRETARAALGFARIVFTPENRGCLRARLAHLPALKKRTSQLSSARRVGRTRGDCVAMHLASRALPRFPARATQGLKNVHARARPREAYALTGIRTSMRNPRNFTASDSAYPP